MNHDADDGAGGEGGGGGDAGDADDGGGAAYKCDSYPGGGTVSGGIITVP